MVIGVEEDRLLRAGAEKIGLDLAEGQVEALEKYLEILLKWNKAFNLTSIRNASDAVTLHLLDCLAAMPLIARTRDELGSGTIADVGSGGGLPAVPIAVCMPELEVFSIDAVGKKTSFVRQASIELRLANLTAVHSRVERVGRSFDLVICRAFSSLPDFVRLTDGCLADGGMWLAMKGKSPREEVRWLPAFARVVDETRLDVPGLVGDRVFLRLARASRRPSSTSPTA